MVLELSFNSKEFDRVLLVTPSMFGKLEVHASEVVWRFEPIAFYMGELRGKLILAWHAVILPSFSANKMCNDPKTWFILTSNYIKR